MEEKNEGIERAPYTLLIMAGMYQPCTKNKEVREAVFVRESASPQYLCTFTNQTDPLGGQQSDIRMMHTWQERLCSLLFD